MYRLNVYCKDTPKYRGSNKIQFISLSGKWANPELIGGSVTCNMGPLPVSPGQLLQVPHLPARERKKGQGTHISI